MYQFNSPIISKEVEAVVKSLPTKKTKNKKKQKTKQKQTNKQTNKQKNTGPDSFSAEFHWTNQKKTISFVT